MSLASAQDIKRRGMTAVYDAVKEGPVHVVRSNRAESVAMSEHDDQELMNDLYEVRLAASEQDLAAGRIRRGRSAELMAELRGRH